jgi:ELWxxDGT repeat protein
LKDINTVAPFSSFPSYPAVTNGTLFFTAEDRPPWQSDYPPPSNGESPSNPFVSNDGVWKSDGTAAGTVLLKDFPQAFGNAQGFYPNNLTAINGSLFFQYRDQLWGSDGTAATTVLLGSSNASRTAINGTMFFTSGEDLWRSDGTAAGTTMVANFNPGTSGSYPGALTPVDGMVFFTASDGTNGEELWKSDGTPAGTTMVADINPGAAGSNPSGLQAFGNTLFFSANDGTHGTQLWRTDGTSPGTVMLTDVNPSGGGMSPGSITDINGTLFFPASDTIDGTQMWTTDGTVAGTAMVTDVNPAGGGLYYPRAVAELGGTLVFTTGRNFADLQQVHVEHLWRSDGTTVGTAMLAPIGPAPPELFQSFPGPSLVVNGTLFFTSNDGTDGLELWKTDGTIGGTTIVKDINPGAGSSYPASLTDFNGTLFFTDNDGTDGEQLWKSNGTAAGTIMVTDLNSSGGGVSPTPLMDFNGLLTFIANDGVHGSELWKSDGTSSGTAMVADINPGAVGSYPGRSLYGGGLPLTAINGSLVFSANDGTHGEQLWKSDGTAAGTSMVKDINTTTMGSHPNDFVPFNGAVYFAANDGVHGSELWRSDGTATGTTMVADINPGAAGSDPGYLTVFNGLLFFVANDGVHGSELWRSDGTATGTNMVADINPGSGGSNPYYLTVFDGALFFEATDGVDGEQLWKTDGTAAGTVMVTDVNSSGGGLYPVNLTDVNGTLFFSGYDPSHGQELWKSDGTTAGTVMVADINPGSGGSYPVNLTGFDGALFFTANDGTHGAELWKSDGTAAGTTMVADINPGSSSAFPGSSPSDYAYPSKLLVMNGTLFFAANDGVDGTALWRSDGTAAGTVMVAPVSPGPMTVFDGELFFGADLGGLWKSDGTAAGTVMVVGNVGVRSIQSSPQLTFATVDGVLFYAGYDLVGTHGTELWESDGTTGGTSMVADLYPGRGRYGSLSSYPSYLTSVGGTLFFSANDGPHGFEPWKLTNNPATATTLIASSSAAVAGQVETLTAAVAPVASFADTPTGTVTFYDGSTALATVPLDAAGNAMLSTSTLAVGGHDITAAYNGDGSFYTASTSAAVNEQVAALTAANLQAVVDALPPAASGNTITIAPPDTGTIDAALSSVAGLTASASSPVNVVLNLSSAIYQNTDNNGNTVKINATAPANSTLVLTGRASGTATIYDLATSGAVTVEGNIRLIGNSPALTVTAGQAIVEDGVTLVTATDAPTVLVTGGSLIIRQSIIESTGGYGQPAILVTTGTLNLGTSTSPGGDTISVSGPGQLVQAASPGSVTASGDSFAINGTTLAATSLSFTAGASSANPAPFGLPLTFTATITGSSAGPATPTGTVGFFDTTTGNDLGDVPLSGGTASLSTTALPVGTQTIILSYSGDGQFAPSQTTVNVNVVSSLLVLNGAASGALTASGNASIQIPGAIVVGSSSSAALSAAGNAQIHAAVIDVTGGSQKAGAATINPAPITGLSVHDPLAGLAGPNPACLTAYGAVNLTSGARTICPGIYSQIAVSGKASLTLNPGTYIIEGGGLTVTGNANISGAGVTLYNAGSNYPNSGGNFGGITFSGNGTFNLSAPTTGPYAGILIFQSRQNTRALSFSGSAMAGLTGTIYAANALLSMSGNSSLQNPLVVGMLNLSGNVALTQTASGSDGTGDTSGIANTLLAGDLSVYIDDPSGLFTGDELARIQDAINAWDAILAPYNVTITEASDPALANVVIDMSTTTACGGIADGVLGCYNEPNSEITMVQGWNWYAGSDPTQIALGQYDFETTILHELGHALGLGGSTNPSSPMYETLAAGVALRTVTTQDLNIPDPPEGADPQTAAGFLAPATAFANQHSGAVGGLGSPANPGIFVTGQVPAGGASWGSSWSVVPGPWMDGRPTGPAGPLLLTAVGIDSRASIPPTAFGMRPGTREPAVAGQAESRTNTVSFPAVQGPDRFATSSKADRKHEPRATTVRLPANRSGDPARDDVASGMAVLRVLAIHARCDRDAGVDELAAAMVMDGAKFQPVFEHATIKNRVPQDAPNGNHVGEILLGAGLCGYGAATFAAPSVRSRLARRKRQSFKFGPRSV